MNYQRVDADLLIAGIVVRDYPGAPTPARKKMLAKVGKETVTRAQLEKTLAMGRAANMGLEEELRARKDAIVSEYRESKAYEADVVELLRPDLQKTLGQVHDYKQFVQNILQNLDVILETRFPGESLDAKLVKAEHEEAAIYWAAKLMDEKLDVALFLLYPDRIQELRDDRRYRFHGLVTNYRKIYERQIEAKGLRIHQAGESYAEIDGNARVVGVIPHALIDNAVKYAPTGSRINLIYEEADGMLTFGVESLGPPIHPEERDRIFDLFVRGREATKRVSEGTGFGLASARTVANALGLELWMEQNTDSERDDTRLTTFRVRLPLASDDRRRKASEKTGGQRRVRNRTR